MLRPGLYIAVNTAPLQLKTTASLDRCYLTTVSPRLPALNEPIPPYKQGMVCQPIFPFFGLKNVSPFLRVHATVMDVVISCDLPIGWSRFCRRIGCNYRRLRQTSRKLTRNDRIARSAQYREYVLWAEHNLLPNVVILMHQRLMCWTTIFMLLWPKPMYYNYYSRL